MNASGPESACSKALDDSFSKENHADFICWICRFQVSDPVTCSNGHLFCRDCVSRWIQPFLSVSNGVSSLNGTLLDLSSSSNQKPYCPTCRVALRMEDLKSILGAADGQQFADSSGLSSKLSKRSSQRNIRLARFNSLRDSYEAEIEHLLCQVDKLEEQLDLCRNGCQEKYSRSVQTEAPHPSTSDILERALKFANDLKSENEQLRKVNEDLEMAKLNLSRELKLFTEDKNGGTPQKYGKLLISTQQREIEDLKKERNQLKKAMDRQDGYIKELENKLDPKKASVPSVIVESQGKTSSSSSEMINEDISSNHSDMITSQSSASYLANMSLPSPFRKINLNSAQKYAPPEQQNLSSDTSQCGQNVVFSSKESAESDFLLYSRSSSQPKRALNFTEKDLETPGENSQDQTNEASRERNKLESDKTRLSRPHIEASNSKLNNEGRKLNERMKSPSSSKIPRPRSQSPAQCSIGVRRSPRKATNMECEPNKVLQLEPKTAQDLPPGGTVDVGKLENNREKGICSEERINKSPTPCISVNADESASSVSGLMNLSASKVTCDAEDNISNNYSTKKQIALSLNQIFELETSNIAMQNSEVVSNESSANQHSATSKDSTEDIDLDEIFHSTQRRVETRAASKNNNAASYSDSVHVDQSYPWENNSTSVFASSSNHRANTASSSGGIQPVAVFENAPQVKKSGLDLKLDLTLGSLNTFETLLSPISPLSTQKTKTIQSSFHSEMKPIQEISSSCVKELNQQGPSSPEYGFIASSSNTSVISSYNNDGSAGTANSKYIKEIDETLAEITKLKGQSIQSLASVSNISKHSSNSTSSSPQKPSTPQKLRSQDVMTNANLTPRSNAKRKFQEIHANLY